MPNRALTIDMSAAEAGRLLVRNAGVWEAFDPQPPWSGATANNNVLGLPNGRIIAVRTLVPNYLHFNPSTGLWVAKAAPSAFLAGGVGSVLDDEHVYLPGAAGHIHLYASTPDAWSDLSPGGLSFPNPPLVAAVSATDVWAVCSGSGVAGRMWNFDGAIWTNKYADVCAAVAETINAITGIYAAGGVMYISCGQTGTSGFAGLLAYSGGAWSKLEFTLPYYWLGAPGSANGAECMSLGTNHFVPAEGKMLRGTTGGLTPSATNFNQGSPRSCHAFAFETGSQISALGGYAGNGGVVESSDGGANWAGATLPVGFKPDSMGLWYGDSDPPLYSDQFPAPGAVNIDPTSHIAVTATDGWSGVDPNSMQITVQGVTVWSAGAAVGDWAGTVTPVAGGFHWEVWRLVGAHTGAPVTVTAAAADMDGNASSTSWTFSLLVVPTLPLTLDDHGGIQIDVTGSLGVGYWEAHLGPSGTTSDPLCYSGRVGFGRAPYCEDGVHLSLISAPVAAGPNVLTLIQGGLTYHIALTVVEGCHYSKVYSSRACFPPWMGVGARRLTEE